MKIWGHPAPSGRTKDQRYRLVGEMFDLDGVKVPEFPPRDVCSKIRVAEVGGKPVEELRSSVCERERR